MDTYQDQARLLKCLAHPLRLQILDQICQAEECVCHLAAVLAKPQPYVSQQLAVLRHAGLIRDRREGTHIFYRLTDERIGNRISAVLAALRPAPASALRRHEPIAGCCCPRCMTPE